MPSQFPVDVIKEAIAYHYLVSYCSPDQISELRKNTAVIREGMAKKSGMTEDAFFKTILPEVCFRISAFHLDTPDPSGETVENLLNSTFEADKSPQNAKIFQKNISQIANLPPRAHPDNRLHRKKGCSFCQRPCHYGYFTLVSEPRFGQMRKLLEESTTTPAGERSLLNPIYSFTRQHLSSLTGSNTVNIRMDHFANLSYCLLMFGIAKSRLPLPEKQLRLFQNANQKFVQEINSRMLAGSPKK